MIMIPDHREEEFQIFADVPVDPLDIEYYIGHEKFMSSKLKEISDSEFKFDKPDDFYQGLLRILVETEAFIQDAARLPQNPEQLAIPLDHLLSGNLCALGGKYFQHLRPRKTPVNEEEPFFDSYTEDYVLEGFSKMSQSLGHDCPINMKGTSDPQFYEGGIRSIQLVYGHYFELKHQQIDSTDMLKTLFANIPQNIVLIAKHISKKDSPKIDETPDLETISEDAEMDPDLSVATYQQKQTVRALGHQMKKVDKEFVEGMYTAALLAKEAIDHSSFLTMDGTDEVLPYAGTVLFPFSSAATEIAGFNMGTKLPEDLEQEVQYVKKFFQQSRSQQFYQGFATSLADHNRNIEGFAKIAIPPLLKFAECTYSIDLYVQTAARRLLQD